jgi:hypothetical protein
MQADMHRVLEDGWMAYQNARWDDLRALLDPEVVWHEVDPEAEPRDYKGPDEVMAHFEFCRNGREGVTAPYGVPQGRIYHLLQGDHAIVSDQVEHDHHRCTDIYTVKDGLIREMWTCITHAAEEGRMYSPTSGGTTS